MYEKLEQILEERGISVAELCRQTGVRQSTMSNLKTRGGNLSVENLLKITRFLGVTVEQIMEE